MTENTIHDEVWDRAEHEARNRKKKIDRLVSAMVSQGIRHDDPIWNDSPGEVDRFWGNIANQYGINNPSETTRKLALKELRHYIMATR